MTIKKVQSLLDAELLHGDQYLEEDIDFAFSSDMMSDVLAYADEHSILITGLCNPQVVRTAEMLDIICIVFVRSKMPSQDIIDLANEKGIVILKTAHGMFTTCGILYSNGLLGGV